MSFLQLSNGKLKVRKPVISCRKLELMGCLAIMLLVFRLLHISWRKWCDPQIDYGRELYIPWRMSEGAKWLTNVDDLYGPLSRFIDSGLFKIFGPGIMVLAWANIFIYGGILTLIYLLFKRAWGIMGSLAASFVFVGVFSFSQLTITSNYNFVTPYSQQATHGFFVCLVLVWVIPSWINSATVRKSFFFGLMVGLTAVLKPEFLLASGLLLGIAFYYRIRCHGKLRLKAILVGFLGCVLPTAGFFCYFITYLPLRKSGLHACYAWLNGVFIWKDELTAHLLNNFSGMDQPKDHLMIHLLATGWVILVIGLISLVYILSGYLTSVVTKICFTAISCLSVLVIGLKGIVWINIGESLLGLIIIYGFYQIFTLTRIKRGEQIEAKSITKTLLWTLAFALMTRMFLNGRIFQYGFIQASLACLVIVAIIVEEIPKIFRMKGVAYVGYILSVGLLVFSFVCTIVKQSTSLLSAKTLDIGKGSDLYFIYPETISGEGGIVKRFSEIIFNHNKDRTLVVIPEGIMINYLTRKMSSIATQTYYTNRQLEKKIVIDLNKKRPDLIVLMSRDLTEYGVIKYGAKGQSGELIMTWVLQNYHISDSYGQNPLSGSGVGGSIFMKNSLK